MVTHAARLAPEGRVVLFDGDCLVCSRGAQPLMRLDRGRVFALGTVQSPEGQALLASHSLPTNSFESFVLCEESQMYLRSTAYIRIARRLPFPWKLAAAIWIVPRPLRDRLYDLIARHRYRWFGRRDHCMIVEADRAVRLLNREAGSGALAPGNSLERSRDA